MNNLDFHLSVVRQRNEEMLREVHALRLAKRLRASRGRRRAPRMLFGAWSRERKLAPADLLAERG
jgi:hypothetical protein